MHHLKKILIFILLICFSLSFFGCKSNQDIEVLPEKPIEKEEQTTFLPYEKASFFYLKSLSIPTNWCLENRNNGFVLIEPKTGTEIVFAIEDYFPAINNVSESTAKSQYNTETTKLLSFNKNTGNSINFSYNKLINGKQYTIIETQKFNFRFIYTLRLLCEDAYIEKYQKIYNDVLGSMLLSSDIATIPHGYNGIYYSNVKTLGVYPNKWTLNSQSDYYTCSIANTTITITFSTPINNFVGMDKTTYNSVMQKTVANFSTSSFSNQNGVVIAEGYYTENSIRYIVCNKIYNLKTHSINVIFVSPETEYASYIEQFNTVANQIYTQ